LNENTNIQEQERTNPTSKPQGLFGLFKRKGWHLTFNVSFHYLTNNAICAILWDILLGAE